MKYTEHIEWLKKHCNRYLRGECWAHTCLQRGEQKPGRWRVSNAGNKATCLPHEAIFLLKERVEHGRH